MTAMTATARSPSMSGRKPSVDVTAAGIGGPPGDSSPEPDQTTIVAFHPWSATYCTAARRSRTLRGLSRRWSILGRRGRRRLLVDEQFELDQPLRADGGPQGDDEVARLEAVAGELVADRAARPAPSRPHR